jgi:hypothetical protein
MITPFLAPTRDKTFPPLPEEFFAASLVAGHRLTRIDGTLHYGVRTWAGQYSNCPVKMHTQPGGNFIQISEQLVADIVAAFPFETREIELIGLQ